MPSLFQAWPDLAAWLGEQADLKLADFIATLAPAHQATLLACFRDYGQLSASPSMDRIIEIISEQGNQLLLLVSAAMPDAGWPARRSATTGLVLALVRWILISAQDDEAPDLAEYSADQEQVLIRPMIEQGLDLAYPILQRGGLIN
jgi:hypothetical protein